MPKKSTRVPMEIAIVMMEDSLKQNRKHCGEDTPEGYGCKLGKGHKGPHFAPGDVSQDNMDVHFDLAADSLDDSDPEFDAAYDRFKLKT